MPELTKREQQVAELVAWGASTKEVPGLLKKLYGGKEISVHTVENTLRNIYVKIHIGKATELAAWWFCRFCGVDSSESPFKRLKENLLAIVFLLILLPQTINPELSAVRPQRTRTPRIERVQRRKD
ncbi:MAG: response regulator transcription factor [Candidatus Cryptobacteroides sp.]